MIKPAKLLKDKLLSNIEDIPNKEYSKDISISSEVVRLVTQSVTGDTVVTDDSQKVVELIDSIMPSDELPTSEEINSVVEAFANQLHMVTEGLHAVQAVVTDLSSKITDTKKELMGTKTDYVKLKAFIESREQKVELGEFPFNEVEKFCTISSMLANFADVVDMNTQVRDMEKDVFNVAMDRYINRELDGLTPTVLDQEQQDMVKSTITDTSLHERLSVFIDSEVLTGFKASIIRSINSTDIVESCNYLIETVATCGTIYSTLDTLFSEGTLDSQLFGSNLKIVTALMEMASVYVTWRRFTLFKDALLMSNLTVNPDVAPVAVANSITHMDIKRYADSLKFIPERGITFEEVLASKNTLMSVAEQELKDAKMMYEHTDRDLDVEAFTLVMFPYIDTELNQYLVEKTPMEYTKHKAQYILTKDMATEDIIYSIILDLKYANSLEKTLKDKLGLAYVRELGNEPEMNRVSISLANAWVYAEILTSFIVDHFYSK